MALYIFTMASIVLVAVVSCTLFLSQHVAGGPLDNRVEDQERTIDLPGVYSMKGTVNCSLDSSVYNFGVWLSESLNSLRVEVEMPGIIKQKMLLLGNDGNYGTLRVYTTLFGDENCIFIKGTPLKPITFKSRWTSHDLDFDDVIMVKGQEVEKWVKESEKMAVELYVTRNEKRVVPVRLVVTRKSTNKLVIDFDIDEFSYEPVPESVFTYDKSSVCTERRVNGNSNALGLARLVKREVLDEDNPLNIMTNLVTNYYVSY